MLVPRIGVSKHMYCALCVLGFYVRVRLAGSLANLSGSLWELNYMQEEDPLFCLNVLVVCLVPSDSYSLVEDLHISALLEHRVCTVYIQLGAVPYDDQPADLHDGNNAV